MVAGSPTIEERQTSQPLCEGAPRQFGPVAREQAETIAAAFHAMEGMLWVNARQLRLAEISGHLSRPVKFAGGVLGHLDAGGQFYVEQQEVQPGYWELAVLNVNIKGKALFFKTIGVQQKMERSGFRRVPVDLTAAQGAKLLYQQVRSASGGA